MGTKTHKGTGHRRLWPVGPPGRPWPGQLDESHVSRADTKVENGQAQKGRDKEKAKESKEREERGTGGGSGPRRAWSSMRSVAGPAIPGGGRSDPGEGEAGRGGGRRARTLLHSRAQTVYAGLTPSPSQPWNPHPPTALQTSEDGGSHTA